MHVRTQTHKRWLCLSTNMDHRFYHSLNTSNPWTFKTLKSVVTRSTKHWNFSFCLRRPRDCTSLSSWNVRAPGGTICCVLRHRDSSSPLVRLPSVALKSRCRADEGTGVSAAQSAAHHLWRRRLYDVVDSSWTRHAGVAARTTDRALLQAQCASRVVVSALSAAGQAWRLRHRQTAARKNIWTCKTADCEIFKIFHTLLFKPLCLGHYLVIPPVCWDLYVCKLIQPMAAIRYKNHLSLSLY